MILKNLLPTKIKLNPKLQTGFARMADNMKHGDFSVPDMKILANYTILLGLEDASIVLVNKTCNSNHLQGTPTLLFATHCVKGTLTLLVRKFVSMTL